MHSSLIWLILIIIVPALVIYLLKINSALALFGLFIGYSISNLDSSLTRQIPKNVVQSINLVYPKHESLLLLFILLPVVLLALSSLHSLKGLKAKLNIIPALGFGLLLLVIIEPYLSISVQTSLVNSSIYKDIYKYTSLIVASDALLAILFYFLKSAKHHKHHKISKEE